MFKNPKYPPIQPSFDRQINQKATKKYHPSAKPGNFNPFNSKNNNTPIIRKSKSHKPPPTKNQAKII